MPHKLESLFNLRFCEKWNKKMIGPSEEVDWNLFRWARTRLARRRRTRRSSRSSATSRSPTAADQRLCWSGCEESAPSALMRRKARCIDVDCLQHAPRPRGGAFVQRNMSPIVTRTYDRAQRDGRKVVITGRHVERDRKSALRSEKRCADSWHQQSCR